MTTLFDDPEASRPKLPADVLEFVKTIEYNVEKGDGGADTADTLALVAVVRKQAAELAHAKDENRVLRGHITKAIDLLGCEVGDSMFDVIAMLHDRIAKLEALGPWIEANRLAELEWAKAHADSGRKDQEDYGLGRADAFKQCGYELGIRAGKDLRK